AYRASVLQLVNARRLMRGRHPVTWPAVGASPHDVVWRDGAARLLRYRSVSPAAGRPPILLVCSLINRPYVLDLLPARRVVARLVAGGLDVWLLDWGTPRREDAARGIADYALDLLPRATAEVTARSRASGVHVLGYCMGGTFALIAAGAGRLAPASLIL